MIYILKTRGARDWNLHLVLHLLPAKICNNMPIFAKIRVVNLLYNPL